MTARELVLGHLYPAEMNLYGDRGNVISLVRRATRRGLQLRVVEIGLGAGPAALIEQCDGFFFGGGQDLDQSQVSEDLLAHKADPLRRAVTLEAPLIAVCGGYQLLGAYYTTALGERIRGLGLLPLHTEAGRDRLVGNAVVRADPGLGISPELLVGFENHSGKTFLDPGLKPLGQVVQGRGNDGRSGGEGAWRGSVVGTYLHGPLLPKNPAMADWWLRLALLRRGAEADLEPLDDHLEQAARTEAMALARSSPRRLRLLGRR